MRVETGARAWRSRLRDEVVSTASWTTLGWSSARGAVLEGEDRAAVTGVRPRLGKGRGRRCSGQRARRRRARPWGSEDGTAADPCMVTMLDAEEGARPRRRGWPWQGRRRSSARRGGSWSVRKDRRRGGSSWPEAGGATRSSVGVAVDVVAARRRGVGAHRRGRRLWRSSAQQPPRRGRPQFVVDGGAWRGGRR